MAQRTKFIDLNRSYLPIDPNTLPETLHGTEGEDRPEARMPVVPYEGWNFMPSAYGWRSYFGLNSTLNIDALDNPERVRHVFVFQRTDLTNLLIALCDDGIWIKQGESTGAWTQDVTLTDPDDGTVREWSWAIIENVLYIYRQQEDHVWSITGSASTFTENTPTTLNMNGQLGIFKLGGRLGFWDSDNAFAHSSYANKMDVTPNVGTGANITSINDLIGKITTVQQHGEGCIIYGTKSIIAVLKDVSNTFGIQAKRITGSAGVAYREQVAVGAPDSTHYAWTSVGLMKIENFQAEIVSPELYDYLKESQDPVFLKFLEGRYLAVCTPNADYIDGQFSVYTETIPPLTITLSEAVDIYEQIEGEDIVVTSARTVLSSIDAHMPHIAAEEADATECDPNMSGYCVGRDYPVYKDYVRITSMVQTPVSQAAGLALLSDYSAISSLVRDATPDSLAVTFPSGVLDTASSLPFPATINTKVTDRENDTHDTLNSSEASVNFIDDNQGNLFAKVNALIQSFNLLADTWISKIEARVMPYHGQIIQKTATSAGTDVPYAFETQGTAFGPVPITPADITSIFEEFVDNSKITAGPDDPITAHVEIIHNLAPEYGVMDDRIPWAVARAQKKTVLNYGYKNNTTKRSFSGFFFTVEASSSGNFNGFTYPDTAFTTAAELVAALTALQTAAAIYTGESQQFFTTGTGPQLPYADSAGTVQTEVLDDTQYCMGLVLSHDNIDIVSDYVSIRIKATNFVSTDTYNFVKTSDDPASTCVAPIGIIAFAYPSSYIQYTLEGATTASPNTPDESIITNDPTGTVASNLIESITLEESICATTPAAEAFPRFNGTPFPTAQWSSIPTSYTLNGEDYTFEYHSPEETFTFPGTSFLMQAGSPTPYDILFEGAFMYDTHLKRWGKIKANFRTLLDFAPVNSVNDAVINYTIFGIRGGLVNNDGEIKLFDANPDDSYLKFGKYGLFRQGMTSLESLRADFRRACTGQLEIETSLDGRTVENGLTKTYDYDTVQQVLQGIGNVGKWHNISFKGQFDLSYLECTGVTHGRR